MVEPGLQNPASGRNAPLTKRTTQRLPNVNAKRRFVQFGVKRGTFEALRSAARPQKNRSDAASGKKVHWPVLLFLLTLFVPWAIFLGPLRMSLYRIVLLVTVLPCLGMWCARKAGRIRIADIALLLFWVWFTVSLVVNHGMGSSLQPAGIGFLESVGPYLLARCYIRDADKFYNMIQVLYRIALVLLPFAIVEFITGQNIWRDLFAAIWPVRGYWQMPPRSGFFRVQMGFDHPILFGVCVGGIVAPIYLVLGYQKNFFQRYFKTGIVGMLSLMSLSAGPLIGVFVQGLLLSWNGLLSAIKSRWQLLIALSVSMGLAIELIANRSLLNILVSFFVFDEGSYWYRLFIWQYASASVLKHPLFGIGLNDWERPAWMVTPSMDDFWLFLAVRSGLMAPGLLLLTLSSIFLPLAFKKNLDDRTAVYRTAFLISVVSFFLAGWTVHYWDAAYVFLLFFVGSGVWMLDVTEKAGSEAHGVRRSP